MAMSKKIYAVDGTLTIEDKSATVMGHAAIPDLDRENHLRQYNIAVSDEQYSREQFHSRLSHHSTMLTGIAGGLGVGYFNASDAPDFIMLAIFSALFAWLCFDSADALKRTYYHFIDMLRVREEMEYKLGLRQLNTLEYGTSIWGTQQVREGYWPDAEVVYTRPWVGTRNKDGYYARTRRVMIVFGILGYVSLMVALITAGVLILANATGA